MKQALLLAVPGTSFQDAAKTLAHIDDMFHHRFGDVRRMWAYTSSGVRQKLEQSGKPVADPAKAMTELRIEGITHVAVKSLHLASGMEYTELKKLARESENDPNGFERVVVSKPLMNASSDFKRTVQCLLSDLPDGTDAGTALLLVAHGSRRPEAQEEYRNTTVLCRRLDRRVILSTLLSNSGLAAAIRECKASGFKKLVMAPLMIVAGASARNELAGEDQGSWRSAFEREEISCVPIIKGLGDHDDIIRIWMDDVERMLEHCSAKPR